MAFGCLSDGMTTIRKLITAWMLALAGSLVLPLVSMAAVSGTTYDTPYTTTTAPANIAEHTASVDTVGCGRTSLQRMASGQPRSLLGLSRSLVAAKRIPVNELPSSGGKFIVDAKGNTIPLKPGETVTSSPNGQWIQVRDAAGNPTGLRLDGPHPPRTHPDPRGQAPHAHVPGVTNPDGTPWLPVNQ